MRADQVVTSLASELRIEVRDSSNGIVFARSLNPQAIDFPGFPLEVPISSKRGNDAQTFEARIAAVQNRREADGSTVTMTLAQNRLRSQFVRGQVLRVPLWLLSGCRCDVESERCEPDADGDLIPECVPIAQQVADLDASVSPDVATDAAIDTTALADSADDASMCLPDQHRCDGRCVPRSSPLFCGDSCTACASIPGGMPQCTNDTCALACATATPDRCPNACVNLQTDRMNCGTCGNVCGGSLLCQNRACVPAPECDPANDRCPSGSYCEVTRVCAPGCNRQEQCSSDRMCNLLTHVCDCRSGTRACGSACVTCPSGGQIVNTGCSGNSCVVVQCRSGYTPSGATCLDIDECAIGNGGCHANASCTNTEGSRTCTCLPGYTGNGVQCSPDATGVCGVAAEGTTLQLSCPAGQRINLILFASYGLPTGTCSSAFSVNDCHFLQSQSVVSTLCRDRSSCTIPANSNTFGDDCPGMGPLRLAVRVTCS